MIDKLLAAPTRTVAPAPTVALALTLALTFAAAGPATAAEPPAKEQRVSHHAKGTFTVNVAPLTEGARKDAWSPGRMSIDKHFTGDLAGTSQGEMITAMTEVKGSAGYVAIERVEASLAGRKGSFVLQHNAIMRRGTPGPWTIQVVPDSGTGELAGIEGTLTITITGAEHAYDLEYTLPQP